MNKNRSGIITILTFFLLITAKQTNLTEAAISGGLSEDDIVGVHYILTTYGFLGSGTEEFQEEGDLGVDAADQAVTVSSSQTQYIQKFVDPIFGMYVGETKQFIIDKAYNPYSNDPDLANKDLYYEIEILKLWYDAAPVISAEGTDTTSSQTTTPTTTTTETPGFQLDSMMIMGILGGLGIIGAGSILFLTRIKPSGYNQIQDTTRSSITKEKSQLQEISKILEERRSVAGLDDESIPVKKKRSSRRRR